MRDDRISSGRALPAAASNAARRGMVPWIFVFLAGCAAPERTPHSLADQDAAEVAGYSDIRFFADLPRAELADFSFLPVGSGTDGRENWLVLSAGGAGGAYGAGVLAGWSERGDRPQFDLVTGVSAGALLAPFAFAGFDKEISTLFTGPSVADINRSRSLLAGILGRGAITGNALRKVIDAHLSDALIDEIARRHRAGARLLIVTTNLDAQRSVVWDIGAIAVSQRPDRRKLIGDILEASASIPAIFPPVRIQVTGNGRQFEELHADGGAIRQVYLLPDSVGTSVLPDGRQPDIFVIANAELTPSFSVVPDQSIRVAERALSSLEKSNLAREIIDIAALAQRGGALFRLAFIDRELPIDRRIPFDPAYMRAAYALGHAAGVGGTWAFVPPSGGNLLEGRHG